MLKKISKIMMLVGCIFLILGIILSFTIKPDTDSNPKPQETDQEEKDDDEEIDFENKPIDELQTEDKTKTEIDNFVNLLLSDNVTKAEIDKFVNFEVDSDYIFYGKDSYLRKMGSGISGMTDYDEARDRYVSELDKYVKDNFEYELKDYVVSADGAVIQKMSFKTYYYSYLIRDFNAVKNHLIEYSDLDMEDMVEREPTLEEKQKLYMLDVKALEIISDYFDYYVNTDEFINYDLLYRKGDTSIENDYYSLFICLSGSLSTNTKYTDSSNSSKHVNDMISKAIKNGTLDVSNPYKLK